METSDHAPIMVTLKTSHEAINQKDIETIQVKGLEFLWNNDSHLLYKQEQPILCFNSLYIIRFKCPVITVGWYGIRPCYAVGRIRAYFWDKSLAYISRSILQPSLSLVIDV